MENNKLTVKSLAEFVGKTIGPDERKDQLRYALQRQANTLPETLQWLADYIRWRESFPGGISALAGSLQRSNSFVDPEALHPDSANVPAYEIAGRVFIAAKESFELPMQRVQTAELLESAHRYMNFQGSGEDERTMCAGIRSESAVQMTRQEYYRELKGSSVFRSLGFHVASESLMSHEFDLLDTHLQKSFPDLHVYLCHHGRYNWIDNGSWAARTSVTSDGTYWALTAAWKAVTFYSGPIPMGHRIHAFHDGLIAFTDVQSKFFRI